MKTEFTIYDYDNYRIENGKFCSDVLTSRNGIINLNDDLDSKLEFICKEIFNEYGIYFKTVYNEMPHILEHEKRTGVMDNLKIYYSYYTLSDFMTDTIDVYVDVINQIKFLLKCCGVKLKLNTDYSNTDYSKVVAGNIYIPIRYFSVDEPTPIEILKLKYLKSMYKIGFNNISEAGD